MKQKLRSTMSAGGAAVIVFAAVIAVAIVGASASRAAGPTPHPDQRQSGDLRTAECAPGSTSVLRLPEPADRRLRRTACYQPAQIQQAYGYSGLLASGVERRRQDDRHHRRVRQSVPRRTISHPGRTFGLPDPPSFTVIACRACRRSTSTTRIRSVGPRRRRSTSSGRMRWPRGAKIVLVEAASNNDTDLLAATKYAVDHHLGDVISQSFGEAETCVDPTLLPSSTRSSRRRSTRASRSSRPRATAVRHSSTAPATAADPGGELAGVRSERHRCRRHDAERVRPGGHLPRRDGVDGAEFGCNPPDTDDINCSGGGFSTIYGRPSWQALAGQGQGPRCAGRRL